MADVEELKADLAKLASDMEGLKAEAGKATKLEKELEETKKLLDEYKSKSKTVYLSKDRKLEKFSGRPIKDSDPTAEEWIEDAKHHLKNITEKDSQVEYLYDHLYGQAKDEIRIRPEAEKNTPEKILEIIRTTFQGAETVGQLQQQFYQRVQKSNESLQEYSLVLMKLIDSILKKDSKMIGDRDLMLKERFTDGVSDVQLRREMRRFMFEHKSISFIDFRQMVIKWTEDEPVKSGKNYIHSQETAVSEGMKVKERSKPQEENVKSSEASVIQKDMMEILKSQQEMIRKQQEQLDKLTQLVGATGGDSGSFRGNFRGRGRGGRSRGGGRGGSICYKCSGRGHFARDCPTKGAGRGQPASGQNKQEHNQQPAENASGSPLNK